MVPCDLPLVHIWVCQKYIPGQTTLKQEKMPSCKKKYMLIAKQCFYIERVWNIQINTSYSLNVDYGNKVEYLSQFFGLIGGYIHGMYQVLIELHSTEEAEISSCLQYSKKTPRDQPRRQLMSLNITRCATIQLIPTYTLYSGKETLQDKCGVNQYQCDDGSCMLQTSLCVNDWSCSPGRCSCLLDGKRIANKEYCSVSCMMPRCECPPLFFHCTSGGCIQFSYICDGFAECSDSSDELCEVSQMKMELLSENLGQAISVSIEEVSVCLGYRCLSGLCIPMEYTNDLIPDCPGRDADDEPQYLQSRIGGVLHHCHISNFLPCVVGLQVCFPLYKLCLFELDRNDNIAACRNGAHLGNCMQIQCTNSFKCTGSYCIPYHYVCDGIMHCINGEDEVHCEANICKGLLRCSGTRFCVHPVHVCDGVPQCPESDDEMLCDVHLCARDCSCLGYGAQCWSSHVNTIPFIYSHSVKYLRIMESHLPSPTFCNISHLRSLHYLDISANNISDICTALKDPCGFFDNLAVLDVKENQVNFLSRSCFMGLPSLRYINLGNNPLNFLHDYSFQGLSVLYLDLSKTLIDTIKDKTFRNIKTIQVLRLQDINFTYISFQAENFLQGVPQLIFSDPRLCCIFSENNICLSKSYSSLTCPRLLPNSTLGFIVLYVSIFLVCVNVVGLWLTITQFSLTVRKGLILSLIIVDVILSTHPLVLAIADQYYGKHYILHHRQWKDGALCGILRVLTPVLACMSLLTSGFIIVITVESVLRIAFKMADYAKKIALFQLTFFVASLVVFTVLNTLGRDGGAQESNNCFTISTFPPRTIAHNGTAWILMLFMVASFMCFGIFVTKFCVKVMRISGAVSKFNESGNKSRLSSRRVLIKQMIIYVIIKAMPCLPYPLALMAGYFGTNTSTNAITIVIIWFTLLEATGNILIFFWLPSIKDIKARAERFFLGQSKVHRSRRQDKEFTAVSGVTASSFAPTSMTTAF